MEANDPIGMANLNHRGIVVRLMKGTTRQTLLHTRYLYKLWASWFKRGRFFKFSDYKSMEADDHGT